MRQKYYFLKDYSKAESLFLYLKNSKYDDSEALEYLANIYIQQKEYLKAIVTLEDAVTLFPKISNLYFNLGTIYFYQREYELSISSYLKGIKVDPDNPYAYSNLAGIYEEISDYKNAVKNYKRAFLLKKDILQVKEKLVNLQPKICDWSFYEYFEKWREDFIYNSQFEGEPLSLLSLEGDPYKEFLLAKKYYDSNFKSNKKINFINQNKKIKVGYFSADFNTHPVSILLSRVIELHDKDRFEIIGYSFSNEKDGMTIRLTKAFDNFVNLANLSDSESIKLIKKDRLDIAVDLMGYTKNARLNLFAKRIAPKQISFLGYPGTIGGDAIDYIIADKKLFLEAFLSSTVRKFIYAKNLHAF